MKNYFTKFAYFSKIYNLAQFEGSVLNVSSEACTTVIREVLIAEN
jgi:hypothetical protein